MKLSNCNHNYWQFLVVHLCYCFCSVRAREQFSCHTEKSMCDNKALVLYDTSNILAPFRENSKQFVFAGHPITLSQDWDHQGVAGVVWDAAVVLSTYIEQHSDRFRNKTVIELGAGTGLVGIVAALVGGHVVITDRETVIDSLLANVNKNLLPNEIVNVSVKALNWGVNLHNFSQFDVVLGADVIYIEDTFSDLLLTVDYLAHRNTLVLLACKIRYDRDVNFIEMLKTNFHVAEVQFDNTADIKIYSAYRK